MLFLWLFLFLAGYFGEDRSALRHMQCAVFPTSEKA